MGRVLGPKGGQRALPGVPDGGLPCRQVSYFHLTLVVEAKPRGHELVPHCSPEDCPANF